MKQNMIHYCALLFFLIFFVASSQTSPPSLPSKQGENIVEKLHTHVEEVMGVEDCGNGDEECLERRMITEAHLDYIYTQHQKP